MLYSSGVKTYRIMLNNRNKESILVDKNDNFLLDKEKTDGKKLIFDFLYI